MNRMTRKIISLALVLMLALSLLPASVLATTEPVSVNSASVATKAASVATKAASTSMQDGVTLHCWNWSYANIEANLDAIAAAGYTAVQTSPVQPIKESTNNSWSTYQGQWWVFYQPTEFKINTATNNALGTKSQLKSLCEAAEAKGIKVIIDVVANHLADNGGNNVSTAVPAYLRNNSAYWHDISRNTSNWNSRYEVTQLCMAGLPDLNTANKDIQNYVLTFLKECVDVGVDGFRFDAAKHIEVPEDTDYCASDFWPTVINGIKSYKSDIYIYGEMLDDTGGTAFSNYTKYMSITDNRWSDNVRESVINSGSAGNFSPYYHNGMAGNVQVLWAESHDTYGNDDGASKYDSTQNINKTWALIAARQDAMALYLARPTNMGIKLGAASTNTGWDWSEVVAVNKFHTHFAGQSEYISNSNGYAMVERGTTGAVIVNVGSDGNVNIPVNKMANGTYIDQVSGSTFTVSNGRISGKITHQCGYAVVYNACSHNWVAGATTAATCTTDGSAKYTCSKCGDTKTEVIAAKGHTYVNGSCSVCGAAKPADHVLYFSNSGKWSNVYVYYWSTGNSSMTAWPGKAMTSVGNNVYTYTVPADATYVIFNNGTEQTDDLTIPATSNYYKDGSWTTYATCSHSYTYKVTTAATCTKDGVKTYTCSKCSYSYTEAIPATDHTYVNGVCSTCGAKQPCTSHSWNAGTVTTAATCTKTGVKTYTCSNCGNTKTETIAALGHNFVNGTCSTCGQSEKKDTMTIYFQNNWLWSEVKIYYWGSTTGENPEWPGYDMEFYADDVINDQTTYEIYCYEVPADVTGIVISGIKDDGSGYRDQTPDITSGYEDGICYYMKWDDVNGKNAVGSEDIDVMIPPVACTHSWNAATCTAPKTCTLCGATEGEALGHASYTYSYDSTNKIHSFTCTVCGEVVTKAATDSKKFAINSAAPILSDDIIMKYSTTIPAGFEGAYMVFSFNGEDTTVSKYAVNATNGRYEFSFPGLNPQKMGDNICATLYAYVDGVEVSVQIASYSVVKYCDNQLKKTTISADLRTALSDLLIYGECNQIYEGYKTDVLVTSLLSANSTLTPSTFPAAGLDSTYNKQKLSGTSLADCTFSGVTMTLGAKVVVRLTVTCTDISKYTFKATLNGVDYNFTGDDLVPTGTANKYYLNFDQIKANLMGDVITFTIWEGDTQVSRTLEYSVYTYVQKNQGTTSETLANLLKALYNYGEAVKKV